MDTSGKVQEIKGNHDRNLDTVQSEFSAKGDKWMGTSFDSLNKKVESMTNDAKSKVDAKMDLLADFCDIHHGQYTKHHDEAERQRQIMKNHERATILHYHTANGVQTPHEYCSICGHDSPPAPNCPGYINAKQKKDQMVGMMKNIDIPLAKAKIRAIPSCSALKEETCKKQIFSTEKWTFTSTNRS